jgi:hypothetical protein
MSLESPHLSYVKSSNVKMVGNEPPVKAYNIAASRLDNILFDWVNKGMANANCKSSYSTSPMGVRMQRPLEAEPGYSTY